MRVADPAARDKVLRALADPYAARILAATIMQPRSAIDLSRQQTIPLSSTYRRIHELLDAGLLTVERAVITDEGKRFDLYRSTVSAVTVQFGAQSVDVELMPNEDVVTKFARLWSMMRGVRREPEPAPVSGEDESQVS